MSLTVEFSSSSCSVVIDWRRIKIENNKNVDSTHGRQAGEFATNPEPLIITQNGEAKMAVIEINQYERQQEQFALLRLIALGRKEFQAGNYTDAHSFFDEMDKEE